MRLVMLGTLGAATRRVVIHPAGDIPFDRIWVEAYNRKMDENVLRKHLVEPKGMWQMVALQMTRITR